MTSETKNLCEWSTKMGPDGRFSGMSWWKCRAADEDMSFERCSFMIPGGIGSCRDLVWNGYDFHCVSSAAKDDFINVERLTDKIEEI